MLYYKSSFIKNHIVLIIQQIKTDQHIVMYLYNFKDTHTLVCLEHGARLGVCLEHGSRLGVCLEHGSLNELSSATGPCSAHLWPSQRAMVT